MCWNGQTSTTTRRAFHFGRAQGGETRAPMASYPLHPLGHPVHRGGGLFVRHAFRPILYPGVGVTDLGQVGLWAALVTSAQAVSMALVAPLWGALADRYGRKLMVLRATFGGAIILALMGFVVNVQQLLVLRFIQGIFTGTVPATMALVASTAPKERSGMAMGSLQTAVYLGVSLGPLLGGIFGDTFGYRPSFWITGTLLFISGILVAIFVREDFKPVQELSRSGRLSYGRALLAWCSLPRR